MLAQLQSIPAARIPATPSSSPPANDQPIHFGSHFSAQPSDDPISQQPDQPGIRHLLGVLPDAEANAASIDNQIQATATTIAGPGAGIALGAGLAHDAGNLLGALGLYCDLLRVPGVLGPEHRHYATELGLIATRSSDLIRQLLEEPHRLTSQTSDPFSNQPASTQRRTEALRSHANALPFQPTDVRRRDDALRDVSQAAANLPALTHVSALRLLAPVLERIAAGCATVSICVPATLPPLDVSVEALERITVNLVRNAAEAIRLERGDDLNNGLSADNRSPMSRPKGAIRVTLGAACGKVRLTVEDDGPGMPPAVAAAFLQPGSPPVKTGRGLGHRIVHELATGSGGHISIRVRPGQGTAFCIQWLPSSLVRDPASTAAKSTPPSARYSSPRPSALSELAPTLSLSLQGEPSTC